MVYAPAWKGEHRWFRSSRAAYSRASGEAVPDQDRLAFHLRGREGSHQDQPG